MRMWMGGDRSGSDKIPWETEAAKIHERHLGAIGDDAHTYQLQKAGAQNFVAGVKIGKADVGLDIGPIHKRQV